MWVAPFRDARINSCLQIPEPFRSLPRPSSPPDSLGIHRSLLSSFLMLRAPHFPRPRGQWTIGAACESFLICSCLEIAVPIILSSKKLLTLKIYTDSLSVFLYLLIFSLSIVNDLIIKRLKVLAPYLYLFHGRRAFGHAPKRRCSSHTFRYGYLVTT